MKVPCISDFSALIGIDWADKKHDVCEIDPDSKSSGQRVSSLVYDCK